MKNAKELHDITATAVNMVLEQHRERAIKTLNDKIVPQMEQAAARGKFWMEFHVDTGISLDTIVNELQNNGYKATRSGRTLRISWV